ncbi:MAG: ligase-associated DNA damage response endonuclease PdeM [Rubrivivax sp.]|nr:MAG: ligase-associated DNA damage response endonuclease PdeM [Rubrivivax sp.]
MHAPAAMSPADHCLHWPPGSQQHTLWLMPERAAFEPETRTLFVADVHLGKAAVFRARGLPVPQGTSTDTLSRLSQALDRSGARHMVVLGDFLHARESHAPGTLAALSAWRDRHPDVDALVVEGNHDVHAGQVQASLGIVTRTAPYVHGFLHGLHAPPPEGQASSEASSGALTLAGHVHPVARLRGRIDSLRLPVFWLRDAVLVLPAFGEFTGGYAIGPSRQPGEQRFVVGEQVTPLLNNPAKPARD